MAREDLLRLGARLKLDSAAAEVVGRLDEAGIASVLLKGSALAERLYDASEVRSHDDIDLLVAAADAEAAGEVLRRAGFAYAADDAYAQDWIRAADGVTVDVHVTFLGVGVAPAGVWAVLAPHTTTVSVGGSELTVFDDPALALHVALHAAQHGPKAGKALDDLRRAAERIDVGSWQRAEQLARRLDAVPALSAGLRLVPEGEEIAHRLGLPVASLADVMLRASSPPPTTFGLQRLLGTHGVRGKLRFLAHEIAPSPTFMRAVYPIAQRGPVGLAAAYAWRPFWLAWHAVPAARAWRRAERESRRVRAPKT
jgi:Uncharacterised nucleotidyltransferase